MHAMLFVDPQNDIPRAITIAKLVAKPAMLAELAATASPFAAGEATLLATLPELPLVGVEADEEEDELASSGAVQLKDESTQPSLMGKAYVEGSLMLDGMYCCWTPFW